MSWQDEQKERLAGFPQDVRTAHDHSSNQRAEVVDSTLCGCFYCCETFPSGDIGADATTRIEAIVGAARG